jgi:DNA-binding NarL/FixJ family response regulator
MKMEEKFTVLVVDDEPEFVDSLRAELESKSYQVVTAASRVEAQKIAKAEGPDAMVIGTITPRGDACLLCRWIKQNTKSGDVPVVVLDAPPGKQATRGWRKAEGRAMEAEDYLIKPVDPQALVPRIEILLDRGSERIKVLVVDDHAMVRDGIRALLGVQRDMQLVGEAVDGRDAVEKARKYAPDIVLMDIVMPVMNGLKATEVICKECQRTKVLMLSQYDDDENIRESVKVGASGFIPKNIAATQLLSAIRSAS